MLANSEIFLNNCTSSIAFPRFQAWYLGDGRECLCFAGGASRPLMHARRNGPFIISGTHVVLQMNLCQVSGRPGVANPVGCGPQGSFRLSQLCNGPTYGWPHPPIWSPRLVPQALLPALEKCHLHMLHKHTSR